MGVNIGACTNLPFDVEGLDGVLVKHMRACRVDHKQNLVLRSNSDNTKEVDGVV